jgi:hypothetical protein
MADFQQIRQDERQRLLNIFKGNIPGFYTPNEGFYNKDLYEKLIESLVSYHDDACLRQERVGNTLADNICKFTLAYNPGPISEDQAIPNAGLVNGRPTIGEPTANGANYSHPFDGRHVITKVNMEYKPTILNEVFINMVIINEYLLEHPDAPFVPTYGFFLCPERFVGRNIEICKNGDHQNHLYMSQRQLQDVVPFEDFIRTASKETIIMLFVKIIEALIDLHRFRDYKLIHGDLHSANILVKRDGSSFWIIDWGMSSFTYNGKRFTNWMEDSFTHCRDSATVVCDEASADPNPFQPLISGAYDVILLLRTMKRVVDESYFDWGNYILHNLFKFKQSRYQVVNLFTSQLWIYRELSQYPEERLYNYNLLQTYSYDYLLNKIYEYAKKQFLYFPKQTSFLFLVHYINIPTTYGTGIPCDENHRHGFAIWFCLEERKFMCDACNDAFHIKHPYHHRINLEHTPEKVIKEFRDISYTEQLRKEFRDSFAEKHSLTNYFYNPFRLHYYEKGMRKKSNRKRRTRKSKQKRY